MLWISSFYKSYPMLFFIGLAIILIANFYIIWNLYRKVIFLQDVAKQNEQALISAVNTVELIHKLLTNTYVEMKRVDRRGGFEADDEVGFAFKALFEGIQQVKYQLDLLTKPDNESQENSQQPPSNT